MSHDRVDKIKPIIKSYFSQARGDYLIVEAHWEIVYPLSIKTRA